MINAIVYAVVNRVLLAARSDPVERLRTDLDDWCWHLHPIGSSPCLRYEISARDELARIVLFLPTGTIYRQVGTVVSSLVRFARVVIDFVGNRSYHSRE